MSWLKMGARIAFITHSQYPVEPRARRMAEALARQGHHVDVYCLRHPGEAATEVCAGVQINRLPVARQQGKGAASYLAEYLRFFVNATWALTRQRGRRRYALAQVYNPPDLLAFSTLLPRLLSGMRVIFDVRDMAPELFQSRFGFGAEEPVTRLLCAHERWACAYADGVTVCTTHQFNVHAARGISPAKMTVVHNCPDEALFGDSVCPPVAASQTPSSFTLIYHGGILQRYGLDVLLHAVPLLRAEIAGLCVEIYGTGDYLSTAQALAAELDVADLVRFHGHRPLAEMPAAVRAAQVGVVPVRRDVFTDTILPTKLLEYSYLGLPAVVARTTTISEYFADNMVAYFESGNVPDLARQVLALYHNPDARQAQALRAQLLSRQINWAHEQMTYCALVESLLTR
jgi:glycosyltransferase involved in cell wall biosynthesis